MNRKTMVLVMILLFLISITNIKAQYPQSDGIRFGANVWYGFGSESDLQDVAEFYDMLVLNEGDYSEVLKIRNWNPDAIILVYKHMACNTAYAPHGSCRYDNPSEIPDEDWFLHNDHGRVCDPYFNPGDSWYEEVCYLDISRQEVRQYIIDGYLEMFAEYPEFDGLWVDLAPASLSYYNRNQPSDVNEISTDAEAFHSYRLFIQETDDALDGIGKYFIPEWSEMAHEDSVQDSPYLENNWRDLILNVDGAWAEAFYWEWSGGRRSPSQIQQELEDCRLTIQNNRIYGAGIWTDGSPSSQFLSMTQEAYDQLKDNCGNHHIFLFYPHDGYHLTAAHNGISILQSIDTGTSCVDGTCDPGDCDSCPQDCTLSECCGDTTCNNGEDCDSCSQDCLSGSELCCSGTVYDPISHVCCTGSIHTGDCCDTSDCSGEEECIDYVCTLTIECTDNDGDGYGDPASTSCTNPELDCNDDNIDINPGAQETCGDSEDYDCDGQNNNGFNLGSPCGGGNIALNKPVTASAEDWDTHAEWVVDDIWDGSYWAGQGTPHWIELDLESDYSISRIDIGPFGHNVQGNCYYNNAWNLTYKSSSDTDWTDFNNVQKVSGTGDLSGPGLSVTNGRPAFSTCDDGYRYYSFTFDSVDARYVRYEVSDGDADGDSNCDEIEVYSGDSEVVMCDGLYSTKCGTVSIHRADLDKNGCIDNNEIAAFMQRWRVSIADVNMREMMEAIETWKLGIGCS